MSQTSTKQQCFGWGWAKSDETQRGENRVACGCAEDAGEGAVEAALHDVPLQHLPLVELGDLRHAAIGAPAGAQAATVSVSDPVERFISQPDRRKPARHIQA